MQYRYPYQKHIFCLHSTGTCIRYSLTFGVKRPHVSDLQPRLDDIIDEEGTDFRAH